MEVSFSVNGKKYTTNKDDNLLHFLRKKLNLTGTKDGCSEGLCGACSVLINNKLKKACKTNLFKLDGASIITIEGLSEREKEVWSYAFSKAGAVQCGFCTPGMVIAGKALLEENINPTPSEVKKALRGNICRCTGYVKIEEAILKAAKIFRENIEIIGEEETGKISTSFMRLDAKDKTLGLGKYVDDIKFENMAYCAALRSPKPRIKILKLDTEEAEKDPRCIKIIKREMVPCNNIGHIVKDQEVLIGENMITHYTGDAICLIVSNEEEALNEIKNKIKLEYKELPAVFSPQEALENKILVHENKSNLLSHEHFLKGNLEEAEKSSDIIVEKEFKTPWTEHAFMEVECAIAIPDDNGGILAITGDQGIYDDKREISRMLNLPEYKVRVKAALVGGGFGGKEDMSVQHHAALAAFITKKPVKMKLSRDESILTHPKRHPMTIKLKLGATKEGRFTFLKANIVSDTGAFASLGGPVLQRACTHSSGPYNYSNIDIEGFAVYTNNVPSGAFRGFGVTQSCFALESIIDDLAEKTNLDPYQIRLLNAVKSGDTLPNGQIVSQEAALVECLEKVKSAYYEEKYTGLAIAMKNSGIGVGLPDVGRCKISVENGLIHIRTSASCMGQGLKTVAFQIAQETLNVNPKILIVEEPDTLRTPDSGTSTASRQTAFTGEAVRRAAEKLKNDLSLFSLSELNGAEYFGEFSFATDPITSTKKNPVSHLAYSYSAQVATLDENGKIKKITVASDAGTVINKKAFEGQIEGGVLMGMGYALTEDLNIENGIIKSKYGNLGLLRSTDTPQIVSYSVEGKEKLPFSYGSKGIGELSTIPTAPAIRNAYLKYDKTKRYSLPLENTPYRKNKK